MTSHTSQYFYTAVTDSVSTQFMKAVTFTKTVDVCIQCGVGLSFAFTAAATVVQKRNWVIKISTMIASYCTLSTGTLQMNNQSEKMSHCNGTMVLLILQIMNQSLTDMSNDFTNHVYVVISVYVSR